MFWEGRMGRDETSIQLVRSNKIFAGTCAACSPSEIGIVRRGKATCPQCGSEVPSSSLWEVTWDPGLKEYTVRLAFFVSDEAIESGLMQKLPGLIAERSSCSC